MSLSILKKFKPCQFGYQLMRVGWRGHYMSVMYPAVLKTTGGWHELEHTQRIECNYIRYYTEKGKVKKEFVHTFYNSGYHVYHTIDAVRHLYKRYLNQITKNNLIPKEDFVIVKVETGGDTTTGLQLGHRVTVCSKRRFIKVVENQLSLL